MAAKPDELKGMELRLVDVDFGQATKEQRHVYFGRLQQFVQRLQQ